MKRYAFILLVLLSAGTARAQRYEKNILGIRAGVNVSTYDISIEDVRINTGSRAGFHFAVTDQILLHRSLPLYLETGVGFSSRGGRAAAEIYGDIYNMIMRPFYMQVPCSSTTISTSGTSSRSSLSRAYTAAWASGAR